MVKEEGKNLRLYLEVRGLGVLTIMTSSIEGDPLGKLYPETCGLLSVTNLLNGLASGPSPD